MPYISPAQRAQGGFTSLRPRDPHDGGPCDCDWSVPRSAAWLAHRVMPPRQRVYGTATTDPLGREGPGWHKGKNGLPVRGKSDDKGDQKR